MTLTANRLLLFVAGVLLLLAALTAGFGLLAGGLMTVLALAFSGMAVWAWAGAV